MADPLASVAPLTSRVHAVSNAEQFERLFDAQFILEVESLKTDQVYIINLLLRYKCESFVKSSIKEWIVALFKSQDDEEGVDESQDLSNRMRAFHALHWPQLYHAQCAEAIHTLITNKAKAIITDSSFSEPVLPSLSSWLDERLLPFVRRTLRWSDAQTHADLRSSATVLIAKERAQQLFEMVADYPESLPALCELRDLSNPALLGFGGRELRAAVSRRLLHLGASTSQILDFYVSLLKALRLLDSSDGLLHYVAQPLRQYLRCARTDTVRCVLASLLGDPGGELHSALKTGASLAEGVDEDDEDLRADWTPALRHPDLSAAPPQRGLDILATLVSLYGSGEVFVGEFRGVLSERLLASTSPWTHAPSAELQQVELLKIRFGDDFLSACEVMLKDVQDSRRANSSILPQLQLLQGALDGGKGGEEEACAVTMSILSEHYWPPLPSPHGPFTLPRLLQRPLEQYTQAYGRLKAPRSLQPLLHRGSVLLELRF
eukprot:gene41785-51004_t